MYHDFAVKNAALPTAEYRKQAREAASFANNGPMLEDLGLMEARDGDHAAAVSCFQQARTIYTKREDILRVVLEEAESWVKQEKNATRARTGAQRFEDCFRWSDGRVAEEGGAGSRAGGVGCSAEALTPDDAAFAFLDELEKLRDLGRGRHFALDGFERLPGVGTSNGKAVETLP